MKIFDNHIFSERSGPQTTIYPKWISYARENSIKNPVLESLHGHRFNIIFQMAEHIFELKEDLIEFFDFTLLHRRNELASKLFGLLQNETAVVELRILAVLNVSITSIMWKISENSKNVRETADNLQNLLNWIHSVLSTPEILLELSSYPFLNPFVEENMEIPFIKDYESRMNRLLEEEIGPNFYTLITNTFLCFEDHIKENFKQFLGEGELIKNAEKHGNVVNTNIRPESAFGLLDYLYNSRPHMNFQRRESLIMLKKNRTLDYLQKLTPQEQDEFLRKARKERKEVSQKAREMAEELQRQKMEKIRLEREEQLRIEEAKNQVISTKTAEMFDRGFWTPFTNIDEKLNFLSPEDQYAAVVYQIRFRKLVILQKAKTNFFSITKGNKKLPIGELVKKIKNLIAREIPTVQDDLVGRKFSHKFNDNETYQGKIDAAIQASPLAPKIYMCSYTTNPSETYAFPQQELQKDVAGNNLVFENEEEIENLDLEEDSDKSEEEQME